MIFHTQVATMFIKDGDINDTPIKNQHLHAFIFHIFALTPLLTQLLTHSFIHSVSQSMCVFAGQFDTSPSQSSSVDVFWCDLDGLQTVCSVFWYVRHIIIIGIGGNSTETPKKTSTFQLHITFISWWFGRIFFPAHFMRNERNKSTEWTKRLYELCTENVCYCNT